MLGPPPLPRTLEASLRDLESARPEVRGSAIADLVRHARGDADVRTRAIPRLVQLLRDGHPHVRSQAAVALGDLEATDAVSALLVTASDDDGHVRQMAINALGEIGDERSLPRLRHLLRDPRPDVRYQAIIAFARVAGAATEIDDALLAASSDEDPAVVHIALRVAEERLDKGHVADPRLRTRAHALLVADTPDVALVAAILLAKSGDARGNDLVLRTVAGNRKAGDKEDESAAVELVGALGLREAIPHLERRVWGLGRFVRDTCPFHARIALARLGHARAIREILQELESPKRDVIAGAVVSAGRARLREARETIAKLTELAVDPELVREALDLLDRESAGQ